MMIVIESEAGSSSWDGEIESDGRNEKKIEGEDGYESVNESEIGVEKSYRARV